MNLFESPLETHVEVVPFTGVGRSFSYRVPVDLIEQVKRGMCVSIPFNGQIIEGIVWNEPESKSATATKYRIKTIIGIIGLSFYFSEELLKLCAWMARYYGAPLGLLLKRLMPKSVQKIPKIKIEKAYTLTQIVDADTINSLKKRSLVQAQICSYLQSAQEPVVIQCLKDQFKNPTAALKALEQKGFIQRILVAAKSRHIPVLSAELGESLQCSEDQGSALAKMIPALNDQQFKVFVLHGVTGSGKTEVYLQLIKHTLEQGKSVLFLVPEIVLATQIVRRVRIRVDAWGYETIVWHSQVSGVDRMRSWEAMTHEKPLVVVGARSAVLVPLRTIGLVIVDEEHEPSYKQEEAPYYQGRDVAIYRAKLAEAVCVLGSATPALETIHNVQMGKYQYISMPRRIDGCQLPRIQIVNMRDYRYSEATAGNLIAPVLVEKMRQRLEANEQTILFINRRGYSGAIACRVCSSIERCPCCSVNLKYHTSDKILRCHLCTFEKKIEPVCLICNSRGSYHRVFGTQKIEDLVTKLLPEARIARLDGDSIRSKAYFEQTLEAFQSQAIDILIGTQLLAKGLDFPNVTLIGIIEADLSLHMPDFRSAERTFQLLVQVAGRAGRGQKPGEVIAQTLLPSSIPIQLACKGEWQAFVDRELAERRAHAYPPYKHLIRQLFEGFVQDAVWFCAQKWIDFIVPALGESVTIRGPMAAPIERIQDRYRVHIWFFVDSVLKVLPHILELRAQFIMVADVTESINVDPVDLG